HIHFNYLYYLEQEQQHRIQGLRNQVTSVQGINVKQSEVNQIGMRELVKTPESRYEFRLYRIRQQRRHDSGLTSKPSQLVHVKAHQTIFLFHKKETRGIKGTGPREWSEVVYI
ncbi:hypothetical protein KFY46_26420, partial [Salmonella enterica subsp. enterica serovar 1,4,[5],12:i:-]|nr:hypothetical protein [Salmonella enterica subsp. enterica serovar 1,4,[5],12:i:-]